MHNAVLEAQVYEVGAVGCGGSPTCIQTVAGDVGIASRLTGPRWKNS